MSKSSIYDYETTYEGGLKALAAGHWVEFRSPRGTNYDLLVPAATVYVNEPSRPRLGAVHRDDMSGGFKIGDRVKLTPNATARKWVATQQVIVRHPYAGKAGVVTGICTDIESLTCTVEVGDGTGDKVASQIPFDWLCYDR